MNVKAQFITEITSLLLEDYKLKGRIEELEKMLISNEKYFGKKIDDLTEKFAEITKLNNKHSHIF
jgi:lipoate-protein ligase A